MARPTDDSGTFDPSADLSSGRLVGGRYRLLRELGSGGLGRVYVARHEIIGREVAIKLLHAEAATQAENQQRFEREARALGQLRHPNIVAIRDFGIEGETRYLVMELVEGEPLDRAMASEPWPIATGTSIVRQLLRALTHAHALAVLHRDLKPANVLVQRRPDGSVHVVVLDFGIAKILADDADEAALTRRGSVIGTPAYMAPEQASGSASKPTVDVYAAGLLAYEVFVGRRPFLERDRAGLMKAHLAFPPPAPASLRPELADYPELCAFLLKSLAKKPSDRYPGVGKMLAAFEEAVGTYPAEGPRGSFPGFSAETALPEPTPVPSPAAIHAATTLPGGGNAEDAITLRYRAEVDAVARAVPDTRSVPPPRGPSEAPPSIAPRAASSEGPRALVVVLSLVLLALVIALGVTVASLR